MSPDSTKGGWYYYLDAEGLLWHEGVEFDDPDLLRFFMENLRPLPDGRFHLLCQGEDCFITCEDVPYVVRDISVQPREIELEFSGHYRERLDPATLWVGVGNVLYCKIRGGKFSARFNRKSYLEIARQVGFDPQNKSYHLTVDKKRYPIKGVV